MYVPNEVIALDLGWTWLLEGSLTTSSFQSCCWPSLETVNLHIVECMPSQGEYHATCKGGQKNKGGLFCRIFFFLQKVVFSCTRGPGSFAKEVNKLKISYACLELLPHFGMKMFWGAKQQKVKGRQLLGIKPGTPGLCSQLVLWHWVMTTW